MSLDIAVIGYSCRLPGADNAERYWDNIQQGSDQIRSFSTQDAERAQAMPDITKNPNYVGRHGCINDIDCFDAEFFGISPVEAMALDPQQRLFLQSCWEALEHAAYCPDNYPGLIGLFAGCGLNQYLFNELLSNQAIINKLGAYTLMQLNDKDFLGTRTAFKLNLRGPAITVQTACSTSLVAIHQACQSILCGDCDIAIAGGVSIAVPQMQGYLYQEGMILAKDGVCRPFDDKANGTVIGSGVATVVLKSLAEAQEDGDYIHAVIKGSAINNDGNDKSGYTAPSVVGQRTVIEEALDDAGVSAQDIDYIETHGTATKLGDPIEFEALKQAFESHTENKQFCRLSSVKAMIGHVDTAAGCAGFLKTVLALSHQVIPGMVNFNQPNPHIDLDNSPFTITPDAQPWEKSVGQRLAGVSSFGIGGTNAHMIVQEAPRSIPSSDENSGEQFVLLSASDSDDMQKMVSRLREHLIANPDLPLADIAYSLKVGRKSLALRYGFVCSSTQELVTKLDAYEKEKILPLVGTIEDRSRFQLEIAGLVEQNESCLVNEMSGELLGDINQLLSEHHLDLDALVDLDNSRSLEPLFVHLWLRGIDIPWFFCYLSSSLKRLPLPSYPFKKTRYWASDINNESSHSNPQTVAAQQETKQAIDRWFYQTAWVEKALDDKDPLESHQALELLVVCQAGDGLAQAFIQQLEALGITPVTVEIAKGQALSDGDSLFAENLARAPSNIVFFASDPSNMHQPFLSLLSGVAKAQPKLEANLLLLGHGFFPDQTTSLEATNTLLLPNLLISLSQENPGISYRCIEFDQNYKDHKVITKQLVKEFYSSSFDSSICYIGEQRFVESVSKQALAKPNEQDSLIQAGETYVIIGGLGNIGLLLADFISQTAPCNIVLISRSRFLDKAQWASALKDETTSDTLKQQIARLQAIIKRGSQLEILSADVSSLDSLSLAFSATEKSYGKIHGVVHSAVSQHSDIFCSFEAIHWDYCEQQWSAKVEGVRVLEALTRQYTINFCLAMSSLSSILGGLGLAAYGGANRFMEGFACQANQSSSTRWLSVAWDGWAKASADQAIDLGQDLLITAEEGLACFQYIFSQKSPDHLMVSTYDLAHRYNKWRHKKLVTRQSEVSSTSNQPLDTETILLQMLQDFLQDESITADDDFFALGGDSMLAVSFIDAINRRLSANLSVSVLIEARSVELLAQLVEQDQQGMTENLPSYLVPMRNTRKQTTQPPLFLIHPVGGAVYFYNDLVGALSQQQAVYGLQARGLDTQFEADTDLRTMARAYVEAIRQVQPEGPYFLGGASLGGMIAFEMAQQLKALGEDIGHVFLIDSPSEGYMPTAMSALDDVIHYLLSVGEGMAIDKAALSRMSEDEKLRFLSDNLSDVPDSFKEQQALIMRIFNANVEAMQSYQLTSMDGVRGVFFAPEETNDYHPVDLDKPWNTVFLAGMDVIRVKGNHLTMNRSPNVELIARFIQLYLDNFDKPINNKAKESRDALSHDAA